MIDIRELAAKVDRLQNRVIALEKPLTFTVPECNAPCNAGEEVLRQKIDLLIAYFERRDRENAKRAEKLECKARTSFNPLNECEKMDRSSYFFSGKSEAYANAASKVKEVLRLDSNAGYSEAPKPEKWVVECKAPSTSEGFWVLSEDRAVNATYGSEAEAWEAIRKNRVATGDKLDRRPRSVE